MKVALTKLRLVMHLLHGMWTIAVYFPRLSQAQKHERNRKWSLKFLRLAGVRLIVHNDEARLEQGVLVVANHISWIDIYVINAWRPTPFVSKAEVRRWPVVGWLAEQLNTVFIQRDKRSDAKRIVHQLAARLAAGGAICFFPEGTTSEGVELLPFRTNLFQAVVGTPCSVQPISLLYEDAHGRQSSAPAYIGDMSLGASLDTLLRGGPLVVHVYVGEPFVALAAGNRRALAQQAQEAVAAGLKTLQAQLKPMGGHCPLTTDTVAEVNV